MTKILNRILHRLARPMAAELGLKQEGRLDNEVVAQKTLMQQYRLLAAQGKQHLPDLRDAGFRKYSQFEEDGILLYLFSLITPLNRTCVEICAGTGRECNTANLIINHGWWGHLFDGDDSNVARARQFFAEQKDTFLYPPRFSKAWITAENVNDLIATSGATGPVDLLSLDIDGMDYWVWKAITVIQPQVVVCEIHNPVPADQALTVPYDPGFVCQNEEYRGASLAAMCQLGREKGYRLVGTHRFGFNAFFVKQGVGEEFFPEVDAASCLQDPFTQLSRKERWPKAQGLPWQKV
ncbi:MAG: hypothetical protein V4675_07505 [Verrucomicrobiota bacterium]